ncbi:MAG: type II secretion system GspH family protein, partial [Phycisphaerae bacterium]|nr:type II secretion system GspH family protein [Phycisphaerae bacterium]
MPTSTVQMPTNPTTCKSGKLPDRKVEKRNKHGFSLMEITIVMVILSLLTTVVMVNFVSNVGKSSFKREAIEIVNTLKMAQNAAARSGRRYIVLFDFIEQKYTMKEIRNLDEFFLIVEEDEGEEL